MNRKMNVLISALFTLIVSSAVTAQTPVPTPGPSVYTPPGGGFAPSATSPGLNGTYQPGVITTQPPAPALGSGIYMTTGGGVTRPPQIGVNQTYQMNGTYQPGVITTQPPAPGPGVYTPNGGGFAPSAISPGLNGTYQMNTQGAGAVGGTAYGSTTYNTNASGGQGGQLLTGPEVGAGTAPTNRANNGYGSYTSNRSLTGPGGAASSQTTTVGSGAYPTYGRTQSGSTYSGTQSGSTYNGSQSSSIYGASRRP